MTTGRSDNPFSEDIILSRIGKSGLDRFLYDRVNFETRTPVTADRETFGLDTVRAILSRTGISVPGRIIHVAGTNGKGSVCFFLEQGLLAAGKSVGTFLSPHVESVTERFRINGEAITPDTLLDAVALLREKADDMLEECTTFEILFLIAAVVFTRAGTEWTVLETGLGGRLDTTNIVVPAASVITPVSLDHTAILGGTLEEIAFEKAGIIKPGVPCYTASQEESALAVLMQTALKKGTRIHPVPLPLPEYRSGGLAGGTVLRNGINWTVRMPGAHQAANLHLSLTVLEGLGVTCDRTALGGYLGSRVLPARQEFFPGTPDILLDGGHNPAAALSLSALLAARGEKVHFLCAMNRDKDAGRFLRILEPLAASFTFTGTGNPRSMNPDDLQTMVSVPSGSFPVPRDAFREAVIRTGEGLLCICGSFYLAGELRGNLTAPHRP